MPTSSMPPDDITRFRHMIEAGEAACRFVADRQRGDLDTDLMLQFALVRKRTPLLIMPVPGLDPGIDTGILFGRQKGYAGQARV